MERIAVAASSELAARSGIEIARAGGNAVDAAISAALVSMISQPGICAVGGSGFVSLWPAGARPATIDGYTEIPGRGLPLEQRGQACRRVHLEYGGGTVTVVGPGSVGTPGGLAALGLASERYGALPWHEVLQPACRCAREGFPLGTASHQYLVYSGEPIFGQYPDSRAALFSQNGCLKHPGDPVLIPHLADSLDRIAKHGYQEFYTGELARHIASEFQREGGLVTLRDLAEYRPLLRKPLEIPLDDWTIATNPPPAIGGSTLGAMLILAARARLSNWGAQDVARLVDIQHRVLAYRRRRLDLSQDLERDARQLIDESLTGRLDTDQSGSTIHASVVDSAGNACAATMSAGYGSGYLPRETGIWMNNSLGELELNRRGLDMGPPGGRLPSNMAPTVARSADGASLAIGSPGADRITTAILQTLLNHIHLGMPLQAAIDHPRTHLEWIDDKEHVATEPGLDMSQVCLPVRGFTKPSMYFGGVAASVWHPLHGFTVAADHRRAGATATS